MRAQTHTKANSLRLETHALLSCVWLLAASLCAFRFHPSLFLFFVEVVVVFMRCWVDPVRSEEHGQWMWFESEAVSRSTRPLLLSNFAHWQQSHMAAQINTTTVLFPFVRRTTPKHSKAIAQHWEERISTTVGLWKEAVAFKYASIHDGLMWRSKCRRLLFTHHVRFRTRIDLWMHSGRLWRHIVDVSCWNAAISPLWNNKTYSIL